MKTITAALFAFGLILASPSAQAKDVPLLNLGCETCKGVEIPIGLMVVDQNPRAIQGMYFLDEDGLRKAFTVAQLREPMMVYDYKGYDAAFADLATNSAAGVAKLHMRYLKNAIRKTYGEITFNVRYNSSINQYQVINPDGDRPITQAYITPNKFLGKMVGIYRIDMR